MSFGQIPMHLGDFQDAVNASQQLDSITLGQLRAMVTSAPKAKACPYTALPNLSLIWRVFTAIFL